MYLKRFNSETIDKYYLYLDLELTLNMRPAFIVFGLSVAVLIGQTHAMIPAYSVSALRLAFDEISTVLPIANQLACLLLPFLINLINNLNNLSNIVQNLTPALLPYFGCTLPLLYATLTDLASVLFLYISVLISLFRSNVLAAPGLLLGLVAQVLNLVLNLLSGLSDGTGLLCSLIKLITSIVVELEKLLV